MRAPRRRARTTAPAVLRGAQARRRGGEGAGAGAVAVRELGRCRPGECGAAAGWGCGRSVVATAAAVRGVPGRTWRGGRRRAQPFGRCHSAAGGGRRTGWVGARPARGPAAHRRGGPETSAGFPERHGRSFLSARLKGAGRGSVFALGNGLPGSGPGTGGSGG